MNSQGLCFTPSVEKFQGSIVLEWPVLGTPCGPLMLLSVLTPPRGVCPGTPGAFWVFAV